MWTERLVAYIHERLPSASEVRLGELSSMPAGASNETIGLDLLVTCGGLTSTLPLVLRPQRDEGVLAPYDVLRQFRVMRALAGTAVPVPVVAWAESDETIIGSPFYVMTREPGETLPLFWYGGMSPRLHAVAASLASIHAVEWRDSLSFLLPDDGAEGPSTPLDADLAPWRTRAIHSRIENAPLLVRLGEFLRRNEPKDGRLALLHGDPNPGNYLMLGDRVHRVLDWELAGIGDPRADLGFYAALLTVFGGIPAANGHTLLSQAYASVCGVPLHSLEYYEGVGLYKMAILMAGWTGRVGFGRGLEPIARRLSVLFGPQWAG